MALSKRANRREERLRAEATDRLIWGVTLHVEVHEKKGAPQNATAWAWALMPAIQERRSELAAVLTPKMRDPSESGTVQSEVPRFRKSHLCFRLDFWLVHLFIPHMQTFTVQGCSVCQRRLCLRLKVWGQTCLDLDRSDRPQVPTHENCSYSQWCHIVDFSRCEKSLMDFQ